MEEDSRECSSSNSSGDVQTDDQDLLQMEEDIWECSSSNSSDDDQTGDQDFDHVCSECCRRFATKRGLNCHVTTTHGGLSRAVGRIKCPHCAKDYSNQGNLSRHMQNQHGQCAGAFPYARLASPEQVSSQNFDPSYTVGDIVNVSNAVKGIDDNGNSAKSLVNMLSSLHHKEPTKRKSDEIRDYPTKRAKTQTRLCTKCKRSFKSETSLIKHQATCNKKRIKNPNTAKKAFVCDKCEKSYDSKATLKKHVQNKHEDKVIVEKPNNKKYDCVLCKGVLVKIKEHYNSKHKVVNPEQITFHDINLVPFHMDIAKGALGTKKKLQKCNRRYDDNTCRLCENHTNNLRNHYITYHQVDAGSLNNIRLMFRDSLGEIDPKPKPDIKKVNASDENKTQDDDEDDDDDDDDRLIYRCKCGIYTETYDATVEHSQEHLIGKHTNEEISRAAVFEISDGDIVINYDYENLLTEAWLDMFKDVAVDKESILASSIYKCFRNVKLRSEDPDCNTGILEYQCSKCKVFIDLKKIENHCINDTCVEAPTQKFSCDECDYLFSKSALAHHKENHAVGIRIVTFNNENDVQKNRILEKVKCSINDLQKEKVNGQHSTENVVVNDGSAIRKGSEPHTQVININEYAVTEENTIRGETEPQLHNIIEQAANDKNKTKEVTEPQPKVDHIDQNADSPANDVNNKENDDARTNELPVSNDSFIQALNYSIIIIPADISMSGSENVAADVENTGSLEKNVRDQLNVTDNQDTMTNDDIRQKKAKSKYKSGCEHVSVTRKVFEPKLPLEQLHSDRISFENQKCPTAAIQPDSNINVNENIAVDSENTGLLEKSLRENQETMNSNDKNGENAQFKLQESDLEPQANHVGEDKDGPYDVNTKEKENNVYHETLPCCSNVEFPSDNRSQGSNKNMNQNCESAEAIFTNNEDPDSDIGAQPINEGETDFSEDKITGTPPPESIHSPIHIPNSLLKTSDQSNRPTFIPDITSSNGEDTHAKEIISGDDKNAEKDQLLPQDCFQNQSSATTEVSEERLPVDHVGVDNDSPNDVSTKEKETNDNPKTFTSSSNVEFASVSSSQASNENMALEPTQSCESDEANFTNNEDPDADIGAHPMNEGETDLSENEMSTVPPPESIHTPTSPLSTSDQSNQLTSISDITSFDEEDLHANSQESINNDDNHEKKAQFNLQSCFVNQNSATTEVSEERPPVNHVGEDAPNAVNSTEMETNYYYETIPSCSNLEFKSASRSQNSDKNMASEPNQNYKSNEANFTNNEDLDSVLETQPADEDERDKSKDKISPDTEHSASEVPESNQPTSIPNNTSSDGLSYFAQFRAPLQSDNARELDNVESIENSQVSSENMVHDQNCDSGESNSISNEDNGAVTDTQDTVPHEPNNVKDKLTRILLQEPQVTSESDGDEKSDSSDLTESSQGSSENMVQDQNYEADESNSLSDDNSEANIEAQDTITSETNCFIYGLTRREPVIICISDDEQELRNSEAVEDPQSSTENMVQDQNGAPQTNSMDKERTGVEGQETPSDSRHQRNQPAPNANRNNDENLTELVEITSESYDDSETFLDLAGELMFFVQSTLQDSGVCL